MQCHHWWLDVCRHPQQQSVRPVPVLAPHCCHLAPWPLCHAQKEAASRNFLTEAVIGSLPKALSVSERQSIFASTPLSPTLNLLSSLPSDKVHARSLEGRRLRRHVLRGAVLVFITAGYSGEGREQAALPTDAGNGRSCVYLVAGGPG